MSTVKFCADNLRTLLANHGVKLKSGHAHELVAALFGYKSKAAMLADKFSPEVNFSQVHILVYMPLPFIAERQASLMGLPPSFPDLQALVKEIFASLILERKSSILIFSSFSHLAEKLTTEYLHKHGDRILPLNFKMSQTATDIFSKPLCAFNPEIITSDSGVDLIVTNKYSTIDSERFRGTIDTKIAIKLHRIAGYIGFSRADISFIDGSSQSHSQSGAIL